jgi:hypothetical protein
MKPLLNAFWRRIKRRLAPFFDLTAWVLLLVSAVPLAILDPGTVLTLAHWTAYALGLAGIAVVIARLLFPQVHLSEWVEGARNGSLPAALVVLAITILLSTIFLSLVLWAKT